MSYLDGEDGKSSDALSAAKLLTEHRKRKRRRPPKNKTTYSLTDSGRQTPVLRHDTPIQSDNTWVNVDSMASHIASLLDVSPGFVTSMYYKKSSSFALTLDTLLDTLELKHPYESLNLDDSVLTNLTSMFQPTSTSELPLTNRQWIRLLCATQGDVENTIDLMQIQKDIHAREGSAVEVGLLKGFDSAVAKHRREELATHKDLDSISRGVLRPDLMAWSVDSSSGTGHRPMVYSPKLQAKNGSLPGMAKSKVTEATLSDHPTASECLRMAEEYRTNRNEAFREAARHFQAGKSGGDKGAGDRGAAAYWSDRGRELDMKAKAWDMRSARALVSERRYVCIAQFRIYPLISWLQEYCREQHRFAQPHSEPSLECRERSKLLSQSGQLF